MVTIYFIRHGETIWNNTGKYQGMTDVPLSRRGYKQALALTSYFNDVNLSAIYSSDLQRAVDTALPIAKSKNLSISLTPELREINFGQWEGLTYDEINKRWPGIIEEMYSNPKALLIDGGESFNTVYQRSSNAIRKIGKSHADQSVAVVCHGGTIRCLICYLLGLDLNLAWNFKQDNANVTIVEYYGKRNLLVRLNDIKHLSAI